MTIQVMESYFIFRKRNIFHMDSCFKFHDILDRCGKADLVLTTTINTFHYILKRNILIGCQSIISTNEIHATKMDDKTLIGGLEDTLGVELHLA